MGQGRRAAGNLPFAVTSFVGRRREIGEVRALLDTARLVTLTGAGGVGKTRLALEVAAGAGTAFADGVWLVDLAAVRDPEQVAQEIVTSLGLLDQSPVPAEEQLVGHLGDRQTLVVLDNCEHLLHACAILADHLLRSCARLRMMTTSRETLAIAGEHVYPVAPLSLPDPHAVPPVPALAGYEAPALLVERARAVRPGFALTEDNREAVARLCARLDGIPLAIELAASRLRSLPLDAVLDRLEDRFALLTGGSPAALPRQRTLRALIDWSHELCSAQERLVWARLSVFAGGFSLDAAEGVCSGSDLPRGEIMDLVDHLVARSVVVATGHDGVPRYRMLETIREYGRQRLVERGEDTDLRGRHRDYFLGVAERIASSWNGPGQEAGLARLRSDHGNLRAALEWSTAEPGGGCAALALVAALRFHWCADGFLSEGRRWIDRALQSAAGQPGCAKERVDALWVAAWAMLLQGDHERAAHALDECEALGATAGHANARGWVTLLRGTSALFRGRLGEAVERYQQAVDGWSGEDDLVRFALFQLAVAQAFVGDDRAAAMAERAISSAEQRGERWSRSYASWAQGIVARAGGDLARAATLARAGLEIQRGFNDHPGTALMIELLAWIAAGEGDHRQAARLLGAVRSIWARIGTSIGAFGPHLADQRRACEDAVAGALAADVLNAELARGERLAHDQAIAYALDGELGAAGPPDGDAVLTRRERQVAALVTQGLSNRQIAEKLVLSPRTVDRHLENILAKLGFTSRVQVAAWAARSGMGSGNG
jgi:predicted ATPase/DNA-binding CsgD family transcriptional regulator